MFQKNQSINNVEEEEEEEEEEENEDDESYNRNDILDDKKLNRDLELFQKLKLNFYKKYIKLYENDSMLLNSSAANSNNCDDDDEFYYDALSQSSISSKTLPSTARSRNISIDNISSLSQDELKLLELKRNEIEKFKQQEEFLIKKIEELTQFSQTELLENQEKLAKYNEKCRDELNELRSQYNNNNNDEHNSYYYSSNDANCVASNNNDNKFIKNQKYSTYTPQKDELSPHNYNSRNNQQQTSKSKTWPEKEHKLINTQFQAQKSEQDDDIVLDLPYLNNKNNNKSSILNNYRKYSFTESFESSQTMTNAVAANEDSHSSSLNTQTRGRMFEDEDSLFPSDYSTTSAVIASQPEELINPVDKQIMQLKNINSSQIITVNGNSDEEKSSSKNTDSISVSTSGDNTRTRKRDNIKKIFQSVGKAVRQFKTKTEEVLNPEKEESESDENEDYETINQTDKIVKHKSARSNKGPYDFDKLKIVQILNASISDANSKSIIWTMKFSPCGKFLATAGKDTQIKIWILRSCYKYYRDLIKNYNNNDSNDANANLLNVTVNTSIGLTEEQAPFYSKPFVIYQGHSADILDLSWSKNLFLLSASSDKTVRLWHIYKSDCLCCFYHSSIISTISFHPKNDRYFVSACLAGKLRLWNISDKKVIHWNELSNRENGSNFITAICFCQSGKTIAVGTYDGKCILYQTELLKYYSLINVRSTRGRNSKGNKITGIEVLHNDENKILITSNDSRIRLYDLRDLSLICKYKGFTNSTMHIKASLSPDDKYIMCASENKWTYIWKTNHHTSLLASATGIRRDKNMYFERIHGHNSIITCALFSPKPLIILNQIYSNQQEQEQQINNKIKKTSINNTLLSHSNKINANNCTSGAHCIVIAGCDGTIKVFVNKLNI